jgi:cation:H+ antiporter
MRFFFAAFALLVETQLQAGSPYSVLWAGPGILFASLMIAWGAEATQFFLAQGIALAVLAMLQTLPEFAVEAHFAWHQQVDLLFAGLTGALMLLTGLGWPMIYFSAARAHRRRYKTPMKCLCLAEEQSVQILAFLAGIAYQMFVWWKGSLTIYDSIFLVAIYAGYLWIMSRIPPEEAETLDEVGSIPRAIILAPKPLRLAAIVGLFVVGGAAVFILADPFLEGLFGLSMLAGVSQFQFVQWIVPLVSEAPEGISAFYWAREPARVSMALMNLVSSNINQLTLLAGMLPLVLSVSAPPVAGIPIDSTQSRDLLLALSESLLGAFFLIDMELSWWEAAGLLVLFLIQFAFTGLRVYVTWIDFGWCAVEAMRFITGNRKAVAFRHFREILSPVKK